ncbi:hypothetical protein B296_00008487 [Ensete ventricosum]|uniref:Uncharacterized protein n=1 Tax=Ensete ventricosum TaxID=4639 RepID=A0A427BAY3_ENSVE|nr:hypothetical protein B296_00008487 [Ensete ventricosum]
MWQAHGWMGLWGNVQGYFAVLFHYSIMWTLMGTFGHDRPPWTLCLMNRVNDKESSYDLARGNALVNALRAATYAVTERTLPLIRKAEEFHASSHLTPLVDLSSGSLTFVQFVDVQVREATRDVLLRNANDDWLRVRQQAVLHDAGPAIELEWQLILDKDNEEDTINASGSTVTIIEWSNAMQQLTSLSLPQSTAAAMMRVVASHSSTQWCQSCIAEDRLLSNPKPAAVYKVGKTSHAALRTQTPTNWTTLRRSPKTDQQD